MTDTETSPWFWVPWALMTLVAVYSIAARLEEATLAKERAEAEQRFTISRCAAHKDGQPLVAAVRVFEPDVPGGPVRRLSCIYRDSGLDVLDRRGQTVVKVGE